MPAMPRPIYLIVAGMPCSGKSTTLRHALARKLPLFGESVDDFFQRTVPPPIESENDTPLEERLKNKTWLHEIDLIRLREQKSEIDPCVVHFDLYHFYINVIRTHPYHRSLSMPAVVHALHDPEFVRRVFGGFLWLMPLNARFVVRNIQLSYEQACTRWADRLKTKDPSSLNESAVLLTRFIYNGTDSGRSLYEAIHSAWNATLSPR